MCMLHSVFALQLGYLIIYTGSYIQSYSLVQVGNCTCHSIGSLCSLGNSSIVLLSFSVIYKYILLKQGSFFLESLVISLISLQTFTKHLLNLSFSSLIQSFSIVSLSLLLYWESIFNSSEWKISRKRLL